MKNTNNKIPKHIDDSFDNMMQIVNPMHYNLKEELDVDSENMMLTELGTVIWLKNPKTKKYLYVIVMDNDDMDNLRRSVLSCADGIVKNNLVPKSVNQDRAVV